MRLSPFLKDLKLWCQSIWNSHTFLSLEEIFTSAGVIFALNDQNFLATEQFVIISEGILIKSMFESKK